MLATTFYPPELDLRVHYGHSLHIREDNIVADTLYHVITSSVTPEALATIQDEEEENTALLAVTTTLQLQKIHVPFTAVTLYCDSSVGKLQPYVSSPLYRQIYDSLHSVIPSFTQESQQHLSSFTIASYGQSSKKTAAVGPSLPTLPALQGFSSYHQSPL